MNYRDIVVRLGVVGVNSFVGQLNVAAGAVDATNKKIMASAAELARSANVNMARLADAQYGPIARGGERAVSVMRAQREQMLQLRRQELEDARVIGDKQIADADRVANDVRLAQQRFRGPGGAYQSGPNALADAANAATATRAAVAAELTRREQLIQSARIEAETAGRVASIRQTLFRLISTEDARIAMADRNRARERLATAEAEEARLLEVFKAGQTAIMAEFGRFNAATDAGFGFLSRAGNPLKQGDFLSGAQATVKAEAALKGVRAEMSAADAIVSTRIPAWKGLWSTYDNMVEKNATRVRSLGYTMLGVGAIMGFAMDKAIKNTVQLDRDIHNVLSITDRGIAGANYDYLFRGITELSTKLPQTADELGKGLYEIASAGQFGATGLSLLKVAAAGASAGLATTQESAVALISVLNAYGESSGTTAAVTANANSVMNVLFETVRVGIVTFQQLTQQLGDFVAFGAIAHVPIEQLGIAFAAITRAGVPAAEASTSLNRVLQAFIKPSKAMAAEMQNLGFSSGQMFLSEKLTTTQTEKLNTMLEQAGVTMRVHEGQVLGLTGAMDVLRVATGANVTKIRELFPEIRAARGAFALMAANGKVLAQVQSDWNQDMAQGSPFMRALSEQAKSAAFQWQVAKNSFAAVGMTMMRELLPAITALLKALADMANFFNDLPTPVKILAGALFALGTTVTILGGLFLVLSPRIKAAKTAINELMNTERAFAIVSRTTMAAAGALGLILTIGAAIYAWHASRVKQDTDAINAHIQALQEDGGAFGAQSKDIVIQALNQSKTLKYLQDQGIDTKVAVDSVFQKNDNDAARLATFNALNDAMLRIAKSAKIDFQWEGKSHTDALHEMAKGANYLRQTLDDIPGAGQKFERWLQHMEDTKNGADGITKEQAAQFEGIGKAAMALGKQYGLNKDAVIQLGQSQAAAGVKMQQYKTAVGQLGQATQQATTDTDNLTDAQKALAQTLAGFFNMGDLYKTVTQNLAPLVSATDVYTNLVSDMQQANNKAAKQQAKDYNEALKASTRAAQDHARAVSEANQFSESQYTKISRSTREMYHLSSQAAADHARAIARANSDAKKSQSDFVQKATVVASQYATALEKQVKTQKNYQDDIDTLYRRGVPDEFIQELRSKGAQAADLVHIMANANDKELNRITKAYQGLKPSVAKSMDEYIREITKKSQDLANFQHNLNVLAARGYYDLAQSLYGQGADVAGTMAAQFANAKDDVLTQAQTMIDNIQELQSKTAAGGIDIGMSILDKIRTMDPAKISLGSFTDAQGNPIDPQQVANYLSNLGSEINQLPKDVKVRIQTFIDDTELSKDNSDVVKKRRTQIQTTYQNTLNDVQRQLQQHKITPAIARELRDAAKETMAGQTDQLTKDIAAAKQRVADETKKNPIPLKVKGDPNDVDNVLQLDRPRTVKIKATAAPSSDLSSLLTPTPTPTANVPKDLYHLLSPAIGSVLGYYAKGGIREDHIAQIAPAGSWRVWAEPETGGEAYIPLAASKRMRSGAILEEVANRFGYKLMKYVDGGYNAGYGAPVGRSWGYGGGQPVINVTVQTKQGPTHIDNGVDIAHMEVRPLDFNETLRQANRRRRRANMAGRVMVPRV